MPAITKFLPTELSSCLAPQSDLEETYEEQMPDEGLQESSGEGIDANQTPTPPSANSPSDENVSNPASDEYY